jgi:hypothetical protein
MATNKHHQPRTVSHGSQRRPARAVGYFVTNGASTPTEVGGVVDSVRRLVDASDNPFFRVRLQIPVNVDRPEAAVTFGLSSPTPATDDYTILRGAVVANPAATKDAYEFDVVLKTAGIAVDTLGVRVDINLGYDLMPRGQ